MGKNTEQNGKISRTCKNMKRGGEQIRKTTVNKIWEKKWKKTMITKSGKQKSRNRKEKSGKQGGNKRYK